MDPKRAFAATLKALVLAGVTVSTLHFTVGTRTADADTPRAECFHYVCIDGGACTMNVINHTCCFIQEDLEQPPQCHGESCLFGEKCSTTHH